MKNWLLTLLGKLKFKASMMTTRRKKTADVKIKAECPYLQRVLLVCHKSGYRRLGINKVIDENRNLMSCLMEAQQVCVLFPQLTEWTESRDIFFSNLLAALWPTFPEAGVYEGFHPSVWPKPWPGRDLSQALTFFEVEDPLSELQCFDRLQQVCGSNGETLLMQLKQNKEAIALLNSTPVLHNHLFWIESWLEEFHVFFVDMLHALNIIPSQICGPEADELLSWPGKSNLTYFLSFESLPASAELNSKLITSKNSQGQ